MRSRHAAGLRLGVVLVIASVATAPRWAHAQSGKASAEVLFEEGRRLVAEGKTEAACPKFAASNRLDPSSSTLLNLGNCYEKLGRTASAWATFREAASLAQSSGRVDHQRIAEKRAASLEPTLSRAIVNVAQPVPDLEIRRDGVVVTQAEWGLPVPVDPGVHTYVAKAPEHETWTGKVDVTVPADASVETAPPPVTVDIPALVPKPPAPAAEGARPNAGGAGARGPEPSPSWWTVRHTTGVVVGGVGLVALGIGTGFALAAKSTYDTSLANCPNDKNRCTPQGVSQRDDARAQGNIATAGFVVGVVAVAAAVVLWLPIGESAPERAALEVAPSLGGVTMRGRW